MSFNPSFTFDPSLDEYNVPASQWLKTNDKSWNGVASGAIVHDEDRLLIVQRAPDDSMPNLWEVPGGAVDSTDASILEGCARELFEETGLKAKHIRRRVTEGPDSPMKYTVFPNSSGSKIFVKFVFEVEVEEGDVKLDEVEHQAWMFVTEDEVQQGFVDGVGGNDKLRTPLTTTHIRNIVLEAFRLRKGDQ